MVNQSGDTAPDRAGPAVLCPLKDEALLLLQGPDACTFLQGQTTANFAGKQSLDVVNGAFCNVKGRVIVDFLALVVAQDEVILRISADLADMVTGHLAKYLMFSKVELRRMAQHPVGVIGNQAHPCLDLSEIPPPGQVIATAGGWLIGVEAGVSVFISGQRAAPPDTDAEADNEVFLQAWQAASCRRGEARITLSTTGKYLPQDLNYDLAGWVNFDKGCYTGQEIIARLHWRGTPKRRLYHGLVQHPRPAPGSGILQVEGQRNVGSVVNAAVVYEGVTLLLETTGDAAKGSLVLEESGEKIEVLGGPIQYPVLQSLA